MMQRVVDLGVSYDGALYAGATSRSGEEAMGPCRASVVQARVVMKQQQKRPMGLAGEGSGRFVHWA